jgi:hypothetical protein
LRRSVSIIIPAYNEEKRLPATLQRIRLYLCGSSWEFAEIVVVDDGSRDATVDAASRRGARVIELRENQGKGGAIAAGLAATNAEVILLLDGDLVGLSTRHVEDLLRPVLSGAADVCIGQIKRDLMQTLFPNFSGQRALRRTVLESMANLEDTGFGIEAALSRHAKHAGVRTRTVPLDHLTHIPKLEKHGLLPGYVGKLKATWQIAKWSGRTGRSKV